MLRVWNVVCRGECSHPVGSCGCRRGFSPALAAARTKPQCKQPKRLDTISLLEDSMPAWLEILLDVTAFAGFVAIAMFYRPRRKNGEPTR